MITPMSGSPAGEIRSPTGSMAEYYEPDVFLGRVSAAPGRSEHWEIFSGTCNFQVFSSNSPPESPVKGGGTDNPRQLRCVATASLQNVLTVTYSTHTCTWERSDRKPVPYEKVTIWNSAASNPLAATRPRLEVHERTCVRVPKHSGRSAGAALPLFAQSSEKGGRRLRTLTPKPLRFPQRRISGMRPQAWEPRPRVHFWDFM